MIWHLEGFLGNYLSLAAVTASLQTKLQKAIPGDISDCRVKAVRPEKASEGGVQSPAINLYLYQVTPNADRRNEDLPTRFNRTLAKKPRIALDLFYLVSFYGDESDLIPQRLMGNVVSYLHARPYFDKKSVERTIQGRSYLEESNLAESLNEIHITPLTMNLEEFSRIWSGFFPSVPYALSLIYKVSVVMIEDSAQPMPAKPVKEVNIDTNPAAIFRRK